MDVTMETAVPIILFGDYFWRVDLLSRRDQNLGNLGSQSLVDGGHKHCFGTLGGALRGGGFGGLSRFGRSFFAGLGFAGSVDLVEQCLSDLVEHGI